MADVRILTGTGGRETAAEDDIAPDAVLSTLLGVFPDARVLSSRERIHHDRPTRHIPSRPSWYLAPTYGIWAVLWDAFHKRHVRASRGAEARAARRRSPGRRRANRRNGDGRNQ
jgi:hypothetical protein